MASEERQERTAELTRSEMGEVESAIGAYLMLIDRGIQEGPESGIWKPVPGKQCAWCCKRSACPRASEWRKEGAIESMEQAAEFAGDIEAVTPYRKELVDAAKAWVDANGPIPLPDGRVLGWHQKPGNSSRSFEAHVPDEGTEMPGPTEGATSRRVTAAAG